MRFLSFLLTNSDPAENMVRILITTHSEALTRRINFSGKEMDGTIYP